MEKAALLVGGVALLVYTADYSKKQQQQPLSLVPAITKKQPADPLKLVPLAPMKLQPRLPPKIVGKPIALQPRHVEGYSPCQMVVLGKNLNMEAVYNLPLLTTQQECQNTYIPCNYPGAAACQQRWVPQ